MPKNSRYHRGFDRRSKVVYPHLLNYPTEEDAREAIPALAKKLGLSGQTVGAYIGQAIRHPGVYRLLVKMGYTNSQIPTWIARPRQMVEMPMRVQSAPVEAKPPEYAPAKPAEKDPQKSNLEHIINLLPKNEIVWLSSTGNRAERNPDLSSYKIETAHMYGGTRYTQGVEEPEAQPHQPTAEELRLKEEAQKEEQEKLQRENREWVENMTLGMTFINARDNQAALKRRREIDEFPEQMREARSLIPRQATGPSETEQMQEIVKAVTTILPPVMLPFEELNELQKTVEENRKSDRRAALGIAKEIIDHRKEQRLKRQRERDAYWEKNNMSYEEFERRFPWKPRHLRHH